MKITFQAVNVQGVKRVKCSECGKRLDRRKRFWQTLNPFNMGPDGRPKTRDAIRAELTAECDQWRQEPEVCMVCKAKRGDKP